MSETENRPVPGWGRGLTPRQQQQLGEIARALSAEYDRLELVELCAAVLAHVVDPSAERSRQACPHGLRLARELLHDEPEEREPLYTLATALSGVAVHYAARRGPVPEHQHPRASISSAAEPTGEQY